MQSGLETPYRAIKITFTEAAESLKEQGGKIAINQFSVAF